MKSRKTRKRSMNKTLWDVLFELRPNEMLSDLFETCKKTMTAEKLFKLFCNAEDTVFKFAMEEHLEAIKCLIECYFGNKKFEEMIPWIDEALDDKQRRLIIMQEIKRCYERSVAMRSYQISSFKQATSPA